jgi:hypothetical protein
MSGVREQVLEPIQRRSLIDEVVRLRELIDSKRYSCQSLGELGVKIWAHLFGAKER